MVVIHFSIFCCLAMSDPHSIGAEPAGVVEEGDGGEHGGEEVDGD